MGVQGLTCNVANRPPRGRLVHVSWKNMTVGVQCGRVLLYVGNCLAYRCHIHIEKTLAFIDVFVRRLLKDAKTICIVNTKKLRVASPYHNSHRRKQSGYMFSQCRSASEVMRTWIVLRGD